MSAIGFAAVADSSDIDGVLVFLIEEYPMLAAAEGKPVRGGLSFLHRRSG